MPKSIALAIDGLMSRRQVPLTPEETCEGSVQMERCINKAIAADALDKDTRLDFAGHHFNVVSASIETLFWGWFLWILNVSSVSILGPVTQLAVNTTISLLLNHLGPMEILMAKGFLASLFTLFSITHLLYRMDVLLPLVIFTCNKEEEQNRDVHRTLIGCRLTHWMKTSSRVSKLVRDVSFFILLAIVSLFAIRSHLECKSTVDEMTHVASELYSAIQYVAPAVIYTLFQQCVRIGQIPVFGPWLFFITLMVIAVVALIAYFSTVFWGGLYATLYTFKTGTLFMFDALFYGLRDGMSRMFPRFRVFMDAIDKASIPTGSIVHWISLAALVVLVYRLVTDKRKGEFIYQYLDNGKAVIEYTDSHRFIRISTEQAICQSLLAITLVVFLLGILPPILVIVVAVLLCTSTPVYILQQTEKPENVVLSPCGWVVAFIATRIFSFVYRDDSAGIRGIYLGRDLDYRGVYLLSAQSVYTLMCIVV